MKDLRWKPSVELELLYKGLFGSQPMSQPKFCTVLNCHIKNEQLKSQEHRLRGSCFGLVA